MAGLTSIQSAFLAQYADSYDALVNAAAVGEEYFRDLISEGDFDAHLVSGRAKDPKSVRNKLLEKSYDNPSSQLTDSIGIRIIVYYGSEVDRVAEHIRPKLDIDEKRSVDKRRDLSQSEFGYRSVHIIAQLKPSEYRDSRHLPLKAQVLEIQIRSVLDHAWAAIEHEIIYKSGVQYSEDFHRRFFAIAGSLEVLEQEFLRLRAERDALVEHHIAEFKAGKGKGATLDVARLLAILEITFTEGRGWRRGRLLGTPIDTYTEKAALNALAAIGVSTGKELLHLLSLKRYRSRLEAYASSRGVAPIEVAHLPAVVIAVGHKDTSVMHDYFPQLSDSPSIKAAFE